MTAALSIVFTLGVVIFFHELGHFLAAKVFGVRVEKFSLGFGPEAVGFTKNKTRYRISLVPLGGYVKFYDDDPTKPPTGEKDSYLSQRWWKRVCIVASGPVWNLFLAFIIFSFTFYISGVIQPVDLPVIGNVIQDYPAEQAGLIKGDRVLSIDGKEMNTWKEMAEYIHPRAEKSLLFVVRRGEETFEKSIVPELDPKAEIGLIGILPSHKTIKFGFFRSFWEGLRYCVEICILFFKSLFLMVAGKMKPEITGPIGIAQMIKEVAKTGWANFFHLLAIISINLGLINLIPVPILDGGHIGFLFVEGLRGKPVDIKKMEIAQTIGIVIIMLLLLFATWHDISRWGQ